MSPARRSTQALSLFTSSLLVASLAIGCGDSHVSGEPTDAGPITFDLDGARLPDAASEPDAARAPGNVGAVCSSDADCTGGADTCIADPDLLPNGYCTASCSVSDAASCPEGSECIQFSPAQSFCLASCDPASSERQCRAGYGCASGIALGGNVCVGGCFDASDCGAGRACDPRGGQLGSGQCYSEDAVVGGSCASDSDCTAGGSCQPERETGWPGGACLGGSCDVESNEGCDPGDACLPTTFGGGGVCVAGCESDEDCRESYVCLESSATPGRRYCAPGCASDEACTVSGHVCNAGGGTCAPPFVAGRLGGTCSFREACVGGTCLAEYDSGYPSGYCAYLGCELGTSGTCPDDGVCGPRGNRNVCLAPCEDDAGCRAGYACRSVDPEDEDGPKACVPACSSEADCPSRITTCDTDTGYCVTT